MSIFLMAVARGARPSGIHAVLARLAPDQPEISALHGRLAAQLGEALAAGFVRQEAGAQR